MSIRYRLLLAFSVIVALAACVAGYGFQLISSTSSMVIRLYDGPLMAVSHARAAQTNFTEARRAVEKAIILREAATAADFALIDRSMKQLASDMGIVQERMAGATGFDDGIGKVLPQVDDWFKTAMSYLKPPASGITQLPTPQVVIAKGAAIGEVIDVVVENASAYGLNFRSEAETMADASKTNLTILAFAAVVVGLALAFMMAASFSRPIRQAMASSEEIASGVFTNEVSTRRRDELGRLAGFARQDPPFTGADGSQQGARPCRAARDLEGAGRGRTSADGRDAEPCRRRAGADCRRAHPDDGNAGRRARQAVARRSDGPSGRRCERRLPAAQGRLQRHGRPVVRHRVRDHRVGERSFQCRGRDFRQHHRPVAADRGAGREPGADNRVDGGDFGDGEEQRRERAPGEPVRRQHPRGGRARAARSSRARSRRCRGSRNPRTRSPTSSA